MWNYSYHARGNKATLMKVFREAYEVRSTWEIQGELLNLFPEEENKMKKSLVLAMAMALGVTASAYAANPFSDVPAGHWAYDSVAKLAAAGVVEGYADGAFDGDKLMTRYEMAQIVAKAMAKGADCDKLAAEFADELDNLGVRVAKLEKGADAVKITGQVRYRYVEKDFEEGNGHTNDLRTRMWINGQINDDWSYTAMLQHTHDFDNDANDESDTTWQRAYVQGKLGGAAVTAGRYNAYFGDGYVYDTRADAVEASYNFGAVKATAFYGKATDYGYINTYFEDNNGDYIYCDTMGDYKAVELSTQALGLDLMAGYADFTDMGESGSGLDNKIWWAQVGKSFGDVAVKATYLKGDMDASGMKEAIDKYTGDDDGYAFAVNYKGAKASEPGSWGVFANYWNQGGQTYVAHTTDADWFNYRGFKGYGIGANYTIDKNIVATVVYYDTEAKNKVDYDNNETEILWTEVVFSF